MKDNNKEMLRYYHRELEYLRQEGSAFAKKYPKIAERLDLSKSASYDPHVERLVQSVAFMNARIQRNIDDQASDVAIEILRRLYPALTRPFPSCVLAEFCWDHTSSDSVQIIKRGSVFDAQTDGACRFTLGHDLVLSPCSIADVNIKDDVLSIEIENPLDVVIERIRVYFAGDVVHKRKLFSWIFGSTLLSEEYVVEPIGFQEHIIEEDFGVLHEYLLFCDKFLGFDVGELRPGRNIVRFGLKNMGEISIDREDFLCNVGVMVNLFSMITDPVMVDFTEDDYLLLPDVHDQDRYAIWEIEELYDSSIAVSEQKNELLEQESIIPYFFDRTKKRSEVSYTMRLCAHRTFGHDVRIGIVRDAYDDLVERAYYARVKCTNRGCAAVLPAGTPLQSDLSLPVENIRLCDRPSKEILPCGRGDVLWEMIFLLTNTSLFFKRGVLENIKSICRILEGVSDGYIDHEFDDMIRFDCDFHQVRIDPQVWRGVISGYCVNIEFEHSMEHLLFTKVIAEFLRRCVEINHFVDVKVWDGDRVLKTWIGNYGMHRYV